MNLKDLCCLLLADFYLIVFSAVEKALEVTPENGMILVFGDAGTHNPSSWSRHFETSKAKKIKIFWIYTPGCTQSCDKQSLAAYKGLSEGRIYNTASELNINEFFKDAVHTVGGRDKSSSGYPFNFRFKLLVKTKLQVVFFSFSNLTFS